MGNILITGATGNVGRYVAEYALAHGENITVAGTRVDALTKLYQDKADIVTFDFLDPATFSQALKNVDRVFIMRPPHLGNPKDLLPFITAMKQTGNIKLVCFLSLLGVEHNPIPPHHKIERYIEDSQLPYCHIRPSFFMQNISGVHAFEIKHFHQIVVPVKHALTSFIDAEDIGELIAKVLYEPDKHTNKAYSISGPEAIDYDQVASILSTHLHTKITYANPKPRAAKAYWVQIRGLDKAYCTVMSMLYLMTRMGGGKRITTVFEEVMGKKPQSFDAFVKKNLSCWMSENL